MSRGPRALAERLLPEPVRRIAGTALGRTMDRLLVPPPGLRAGRGVARGAADGVPAVLVFQPGAPSREAVQRTVQALAALGPAAGGARPVLVLDTPHFTAARRAGIAADHLLSPAEWQRRGPDRPYAEYLAGRLADLERDYATRHLVRVPPDGPDELPPGALAAALRPARTGRLRRAWQGPARRLEAVIDRPSAGM